MKTVSKKMLQPTQVRRKQIEKELERLRTEQTTKTRRQFKTDAGYQESRARVSSRIQRLEDELLIIDFPGEYDELPLSIVAEELGVTTPDLQLLIGMEEIEPSEEVYKDRLSRAEIERALEIGVEELIRRATQSPDEIFLHAVACLNSGNLATSEEESRRLELRGAWELWEVLAIVLELVRGNFEDAVRSFQTSLDCNASSRAIFLDSVATALRGLHLETHPGRAIVERMLSIADGSNYDPLHWRSGSNSKVIGKHLDHTQQRAMFLAKAVYQSLNRYRRTQSFKSYHGRASKMRQEEFEAVIRDALYTALHAEETYNESPSSKLYIDSLSAMIPMWWAPAELMEVLVVDKAAPQG
jgi:hypothetical protein